MPNLPISPTEILDAPLCTDEDIAVICYADFETLVPKDQVVASGNDGVFLTSDRWTLNSASCDFNACGLVVGNVVQLSGPKGAFKGSGTRYAVAAVNPNQVTLRIMGRPWGYGQPPGPAIGLTGVTFFVMTFAPQVEYVQYLLYQQFNIDDTIAQVAFDQLYDVRQLQMVAALSVVVRAYRGDTRSKDGDFAAKLVKFERELSDVLARTNVRRQSLTGEMPLPETRFNTSIGR